MSAITTHVLDTARGCPAAGVTVTIEYMTEEGWEEIGSGVTNLDGRIPDLLAEGHEIQAGVYKITFNTRSYFGSAATEGFYPYVPVVFEISEVSQHYHVPLLLSPFGYSTYRGS